jgi:ElaB/YqjD/DUF883 family membrane-anchored ribosome-binding protein
MAEENPEVIREQIRETQEDLATKLSTLEDKVVDTVSSTTESVAETVESVKEAVAGTIESVKETVESTVETVKRTFDVKYQVEQHPLVMMAGACAAGFLAGRFLFGEESSPPRQTSRPAGEDFRSSRPTMEETAAPRFNGSARAEEPGLLDRLTTQFHDELETVKGLAIGALFGLARDWATHHLPPQFAPQVEEMIDNVTTKLGGQRIEGPVADNLTSMWENRGARSESREPAHA